MVASQEERERRRIFLDLINISFACYFSPCAASCRGAQGVILATATENQHSDAKRVQPLRPLSRTCTSTHVRTPIRKNERL